LPSSDIISLKFEISDRMYCALDIRELDFSNENPAENGFTWEALTAKSMTEKLHGRNSVVVANVPCLVFILATSGLTTDHEFLADFLRMYRYFASGQDVSRLLIMIYMRSYEIAQDKNKEMRILENDVMMDAEDNSTNIKLRILNIFKKWIADQNDFAEDRLLCRIVSTFLSSHVSQNTKTASYALAMIKQLEAIQQTSGMDISNKDPGSGTSLNADTHTTSTSYPPVGTIVADDSSRFTMLSIKEEFVEAVKSTPTLDECEGKESAVQSASLQEVKPSSSGIPVSNLIASYDEYGLRYQSQT
jgi:hypothetical protein